MNNEAARTIGRLQRLLTRRQGAPRWMVTFADLMALLLTFLALLVSFSEINVDTFERNAGPLRSAFNKDAGLIDQTTAFDLREDTSSTLPVIDPETWTNKTYDRLQILLANQLTDGLVDLERKDGEVVIKLPSGTTFLSGSVQLSEQAKLTLENVSQALVESQGALHISGHTDDVPIVSQRFRSNWDLSAARAVSVVHYLFEISRLNSERVTASGFADTRPVAPNDSAANRAKNRRVEIAVRFSLPKQADSNIPWYIQSQQP